MNNMGFQKDVKVLNYNSLFADSSNEITLISLKSLHSFKDHPFKIDPEGPEMKALTESIKEQGILTPITVRRDKDGYEIISGHRRTEASRILKKENIPAIIKDYSDDEAAVAMVDSNLQRQDIKPSEKAFAYKMKYESLQRMKQYGDGSLHKILGDDAEESGRTVQRYLRLTYLIPELLQLVDDNRITITAGCELSYLSQEKQATVNRLTEKACSYPNEAKAAEIRRISDENENFTLMVITILQRKTKTRKVTFSDKKLSEYFPENYTKEMIEKTITELLENWRNNGDGNVQGQ